MAFVTSHRSRGAGLSFQRIAKSPRRFPLVSRGNHGCGSRMAKIEQVARTVLAASLCFRFALTATLCFKDGLLTANELTDFERGYTCARAVLCFIALPT